MGQIRYCKFIYYISRFCCIVSISENINLEDNFVIIHTVQNSRLNKSEILKSAKVSTCNLMPILISHVLLGVYSKYYFL